MPSSGFTPSSRCEAASGPAVLLPGTQHPCLKVRIGPLHTQQEAGETKKPREGDVLNAETHHQELQASRLCTQPWKRVPAFFQSPGIASESRGHSAHNRMCPASRVINLWFRASRRHYLRPQLLIRFQWGFLLHTHQESPSWGREVGKRVFSANDEMVKVERKQATQISL